MTQTLFVELEGDKFVECNVRWNKSKPRFQRIREYLDSRFAKQWIGYIHV